MRRNAALIRFCSLACILIMGILMSGCSVEESGASDPPKQSIASGDLRKIAFALVSSAENSTIDYNSQYAYIEDIEDGRGYTAGVIGFTSGTGDLLDVVRKYCELKSENNLLKQYIPTLQNAVGSDTHEGLGESFVADWEKAALDPEMVQAQNMIVDEQYLSPAVEFANEDGLSNLGQYIYYDALVVHGPGDDEDSFNGIRIAAQKIIAAPSQGGDERAYLFAFLDARTIIMQKEEAHSDLLRIDVQRTFIEDGNYALSVPLYWVMYGDQFQLLSDDLKTLK